MGDSSTGDIQALDLTAEVFINSISKDARGELYILGYEEISTCDTVSTGKVLAIKSTEVINESFCFPIVADNQRATVVCL